MCAECLGKSFSKFAVSDVATVKEFCDKYYKRERYTGRGEDYAAVCLASHEEDMQTQGWTILSHHESATGEIVAFFGA